MINSFTLGEQYFIMIDHAEKTENPLAMSAVEFTAVGKQLVYKIAAF
jgi:hypothetical protein